ncbi:MAG: hypothetical protein M5U08_18925 [Burkholderiales bacterium]|nr:hypothetical protein [Burkholderiales bacterium]
MSSAAELTLRTLLGDYPGTRALRQGAIAPARLRLDFADVKVPNRAFKQVVREAAFEVAELAIVTYLQARAFGKPLVLLPAVVLGRFPHAYLVHDPARGPLAPSDLAGRRVGIRSPSVTTVAWIRGILANDHGVELDRVHWVTFEDAHVAEYREPPAMERAPAGKEIEAMLRAGELDAAVLGAAPAAASGLRPVFADPDAAARDWYARHGAVPINHMVVVTRPARRVASRCGAGDLPAAAREQARRRECPGRRHRPAALRGGGGEAGPRAHRRLRGSAAAHPASSCRRRALRRHDARALTAATDDTAWALRSRWRQEKRGCMPAGSAGKRGRRWSYPCKREPSANGILDFVESRVCDDDRK